MARLGTFCIALALALAAYGLIASVWGVRRGRLLLVESARTSAYAVLAGTLRMQAAVMSLDGSRMLRAHGDAPPTSPTPLTGAWQLGRDLAAELLRSGASDLISVSERQANSRNDVQ